MSESFSSASTSYESTVEFIKISEDTSILGNFVVTAPTDSVGTYELIATCSYASQFEDDEGISGTESAHTFELTPDSDNPRTLDLTEGVTYNSPYETLSYANGSGYAIVSGETLATTYNVLSSTGYAVDVSEDSVITGSITVDISDR